MSTLNRKLDKYIKARVESAKKSLPVSPHLTYKVTNATVPTTATASVKKPGSRIFSMTVSFFNPKFDKAAPKDFAIRHEVAQQKIVTAKPGERLQSPRRDPILQNNNEPIQETRPTIRCYSPSKPDSEAAEEMLFPRKARGEFNVINSARSTSPKIEGIRTNIAPYKGYEIDTYRRKRKEVKNSQKNNFDPIVEGDEKGVKPRKERKAPPVSEELKKMNDRKLMLPSERASPENRISPRGRVFWDTNMPAIIQICATHRDTDNKIPEKKQRVASPDFNRSSSMKELIGYEFALPFRDQGVADKCSNVPYSELVVKPTEPSKAV